MDDLSPATGRAVASRDILPSLRSFLAQVALGSQSQVHFENSIRYPKNKLYQASEGTGTLGRSVEGYLERIAGYRDTREPCRMHNVVRYFFHPLGKVNKIFHWAAKSRNEVRRSGPAAQPNDVFVEVPFPLTVPYPVSSLVLTTVSPAKTTPIHPQPIPLTCFPNRSNSVLPVLSKYRIFLESFTSLCRSNSSLAYLFISSLAEGGIL